VVIENLIQRTAGCWAIASAGVGVFFDDCHARRSDGRAYEAQHEQRHNERSHFTCPFLLMVIFARFL
jgi:hypothetical protein